MTATTEARTTEPAAAPQPAAPDRHAARRRRDRRIGWLLVLPTIVALLLALGYPVGWQLLTSFRKYGLRQQFGQPPEWVGLENYRTLVTDPALWAVVVAVLWCTAFCTVGGSSAT